MPFVNSSPRCLQRKFPLLKLKFMSYHKLTMPRTGTLYDHSHLVPSTPSQSVPQSSS